MTASRDTDRHPLSSSPPDEVDDLPLGLRLMILRDRSLVQSRMDVVDDDSAFRARRASEEQEPRHRENGARAAPSEPSATSAWNSAGTHQSLLYHSPRPWCPGTLAAQLTSPPLVTRRGRSTRRHRGHGPASRAGLSNPGACSSSGGGGWVSDGLSPTWDVWGTGPGGSGGPPGGPGSNPFDTNNDSCDRRGSACPLDFGRMPQHAEN